MSRAERRPMVERMNPMLPGSQPNGLVFLVLKRRGFSPNHIVDVGANHGYWTRTSLKYFPDVYYTLIEPQDFLRENVQDLLAREDGKIRWIGAGASDKLGTLPFTISDTDVTSTFITSDAAKAHAIRQIEVPVITLNEIVRTS